jgi:hypothetical protein
MIFIFIALVSLSSFSAYWASDTFSEKPVELPIEAPDAEKIALHGVTTSEQNSDYTEKK